MWAGGRLTFLRRCASATRSTRTSRIADVTRKAGPHRARWCSSLVRHEIARRRGWRSSRSTTSSTATRRSRASAGAAAAPRPRDATLVANDRPDAVLLFRYSALTFNGHRIHYDRRYVTRGRGLSGPGRARPADRDAAARPACAASMPDARVRALRVPARASPLFDIAPVHASAARRDGDGKRARCGRATHDGGLAMQATRRHSPDIRHDETA